MKAGYLIAILPLYILSGAHSQKPFGEHDKLVSKQQPAKFAKVDSSSLPSTRDTSKILLSYKVRHLFSNTRYRDNFSITLYGKGLTVGFIVFKISNDKNRQIFKDTFPASDLLGDQADVLNIKQQTDTIRARMAKFLNDRNFTSPAIGYTEKFDDAFSNPNPADKISWEAVKADRTSVGFTYCHGYEGTYGIAYAKSKKKTVAVFYSD